jgi:hypothetical protein
MIAFLMAYFNGYQTTIHINNFGEAHLELIFVLLTPFAISFLFYDFASNWCFLNNYIKHDNDK